MREPAAWAPHPKVLALPADSVHVFRASCEVGPARLSRLESWLSPRERERAARFRFRSDRMSYVASRGTLRQILGMYLGRAPARLDLRSNARGKPRLAGQTGAGGIRFNLSHSGFLTLLAFARGREVGVDVESIRPEIAEEGLERFFTSEEARRIGSTPASERAAAFFRCWTAKEALLKASGDGLSARLDGFAAPDGDDEEINLEEGIRPWRVVRLCPGEGYAAAVAGEGTEWSLCLWEHRP